MAGGKENQVRVILECTSYVRTSVNKKSIGICRYITKNNCHNTPSQLKLRKFYLYGYKHTILGEIKK